MHRAQRESATRTGQVLAAYCAAMVPRPTTFAGASSGSAAESKLTAMLAGAQQA